MCFLQKRIDDLKNERKTVEGQVAMAENELQKTEDLLETLSKSKTVHEFVCLKVLMGKHIFMYIHMCH